MTKHKILEWEEQKDYKIISDFSDFIDNYLSSVTLNKNKIKILDWGCGRGQLVLYLREQGFDAFGVDVDNLPIINGIPLFETMGYSPSILSLIKTDGQTNFENNIFDIVISNQVFEHIESIDLVIDEIARITKSGGIGLHIFPARRHLIEAHLKMPFIHWLPKNIIRKLIIYIYVVLKIDPNWEELKGQPIKRKADQYYNYSISKTFYRSNNELKKLFQSNGFKCSNNLWFGNKDDKVLNFINITIRTIINLFRQTKLIVKKSSINNV
jgi:SAM-dependent methyltransferase